MKNGIPEFKGFKKQAFDFLGNLEKDKYNNLKWFSENKDAYNDYIVMPSKAFVQTIGQFFNHLNPSIRTEPKFNKTLMRINKDMRFSKGTPYRTFFLIHFGRFKMDTEFYVYLDKSGISYGIFINNTTGDDLYFNSNFSRHKKNILNACGKFGINNKYRLSELSKEPELREIKFNAAKHLDGFENMKYILLEKQILRGSKLIFSPDLLTEAVRTFSQLYPLFCFAISADPLKLINEFEERMGVAL